METKNDILDELAALSPRLAGAEKVNVFTVPPHYFDTISDTVLACIKVTQPGVREQAQQSVPEGYFDNLAANILQRIKSEELSAGEIASLSPLLHSLKEKNVFEVPVGYFENTAARVLDMMKTETPQQELNRISPLLSDLQPRLVFTVPTGYFEGLPAAVLNSLKGRTGIVIRMQGRNVFTRYAVAALMIGVLAFGVFKYTGKQPGDTSQPAIAAMDASIEKGRKMDDKQFNEALTNLTTADITSYLEVNGDITDIAALGSKLDETELPSQVDYLLDEKTLENYLKQIELTPLNN
jgi:hypothetical protein